MVMKKRVNCCFLYGDDKVAITERAKALAKRYFKGNIPEAIIFRESGTFDEYESALGTQSLFSTDTYVILDNPPFLKKKTKKKEEEGKKAKKSDKDDKEKDSFLEALKNTGEEVFVMILGGSIDKRLSIVKSLLALSYSEELNLIKPEQGAELMINLLMERGKNVDFNGRAYLEEVVSSWESVSKPFLETECDKIALMCGDKKTVTEAILRYALPQYLNQGIFHFVEALLRKDEMAVLENTDRVFTDTTSIILNLGFILTKYRQFKILKEMERNHYSVQEIKTKLSMNPYAFKYLQRDANMVTEEEAEWFIMAGYRYFKSSRQDSEDLEIKDLLLQYVRKWKRQ